MSLVRLKSPEARRRWHVVKSLALVASCFVFLKADMCPEKGITDADAVIVRAEVSPDSVKLAPGATRNVIANAYDADDRRIVGRKATWQTSNPSVATVVSNGDDDGTVTAVGVGTAAVTATVEGKTAVVQVVVAMPTVAVAKVKLLVNGGTDMRLLDSAGAYAYLYDASDRELEGRPVTYKSSDPSIAEVAQTTAGGAYIVAKKLGTAVISVTAEGLTDAATVTVTQGARPRRVDLSLDTVRVVAGSDVPLTLVAYDGAGTAMPDSVIEVTSANTAIARVSAATATGRAPIRVAGVAAGQTTLTVRTGIHVKLDVPVIVTAAPPVAKATVTITPKSLQLRVGQTATFSAVATAAGGAPFSGTISYRAVGPGATITSGGTLSVTQAAAILVIASTTDAADTAQVTVVGADSLRISPRAPLTLAVGGSALLNATVYSGGAPLAGQTITWSSTDAAIADVSAAGIVSAKSAGSASIVAAAAGRADTVAVTVTAAPTTGSTLAVHPLGVFTVKRLANNTTQTFTNVMFAGDHEENGDKSLQAFASYLFTDLPSGANVTKAELSVAFDPDVSGTPFAGTLGALVVELASSSTLNEGPVSTSAIVVASAMATRVTVDVLPLVRAARTAGQQSATLRFRFVNLVNANGKTDNVGFFADPLTLTYTNGGSVRLSRQR